MAQRGGLGRGLGALIPTKEESVPSDSAGVDADGEQSAPSPKAHSPRPVDMFFSGDSARERAGDRTPRQSRNIADDMARAAAKRKTSGASGKQAGSGDSDGDSGGQPATKTSSTSKRKPPATKGRTSASQTTTSKAQTQPRGESENASQTPEAESKQPTPEPSKQHSQEPSEFSQKVEDQNSTPRKETTAEESSVPDDDVRPVEANDATHDDPVDDTAPRPVPGAWFGQIPLSDIRENPRNPRTIFDEDDLAELARSLKEVGVLQPIVVRPLEPPINGKSYELVMGERRWRAAHRAGLTAIPCIIRETTDDALLRDALLENIHRTQLNPMEEAAAYGQLLEDFGCTQDELSQRLGRSRPQISNTLRLLKLPGTVQNLVAEEAINAGHARALLGLESPEMMEELAQRIVAEGLSVRAVERIVARGASEPLQTSARRTSYNPRVVDMTSSLSRHLETPVRIDVGKRKGKITLEFSSMEELDRLASRLGLDVAESDF